MSTQEAQKYQSLPKLAETLLCVTNDRIFRMTLLNWKICIYISFSPLYSPAILRCTWKCLCVSRGSGNSPRNIFSKVATSFEWNSPDSKSISVPLLRASLKICCRTLFPGTLNKPSTRKSVQHGRKTKDMKKETKRGIMIKISHLKDDFILERPFTKSLKEVLPFFPG